MSQRRVLRALHWFAHHPLANLTAGFILLVTGLLESAEMISEGAFDSPIGAHHGIAVFGFLQMLKAFPDLFKGLKFVDEGEEGIVSTARSADRRAAKGAS